MNVILVSDMGKLGGTEVATLVTAKVLSHAGLNVSVMGKTGPLVEQLHTHKIEFSDIDTHSKNVFKMIAFVVQFIKLLRQHNIQVVHAQMARPVPLLWLAKILSGSKTKIFWTSRGIHESSYKFIIPLFKFFNVKVIGNCKLEQNKIIKYGYQEKNTSYAYNAYRLILDEKNFIKTQQETIAIGTLAALRADRHLYLFIQAAHQLKKARPDLKLHFYLGGDGPEKANLTQLVQELDMDSNVTFLGNVFDVIGFFKQTDVFVSSTVTEGDSGAGVSNAIVEAMLTKTPVCAFDAAAIGEIVINGQTGYLVEPRNIEAMVKAILATVANKQLTQKYVENAYNLIIEECDPQIYAKKLIYLYKNL